MEGYVTPQMMMGMIASLIVCLGTVVWFLFQRIYTSLDRQGEKIDDLKKCLHDAEVRLVKRIDYVDGNNDRLSRDVNVLFSEVRELKGFVKAVHKKEFETA